MPCARSALQGADDLGLGRMMGGQKDFIGRVRSQRPALTDPDRAVRVYDPIRNSDLQADIVQPVFFDPEGTRLKV